MTNGMFMLLFLTIAQVPFIKYTLLEMEEADRPLRKAISFSLEKEVALYIFACMYVLLIFMGGLLFIVPGVVLLLLFYFVPYFISDRVRSFRSAIKKSVTLFKKHFFKAIVLIGIVTVVQLTLENVVVGLVTLYTNVYFTLLVTKILLLMPILPLQTIIMANFYNKWKETIQSDKVGAI